MMSKLLYRIRSAVLRLPSVITQLMNLLTSGLSYSGSGATSRLGISRRLGIADPCRPWSFVLRPLRLWLLAKVQGPRPKDGLRFLRSLRAVFRTALHAALNADG